jgi:hypothetical protein
MPVPVSVKNKLPKKIAPAAQYNEGYFLNPVEASFSYHYTNVGMNEWGIIASTG